LKSNRRLLLLLVLGMGLLLSACVSNYYNRFGGYPLGSEILIAGQDSLSIRLLVTYRYFYQSGQEDTTSLNITVKPMINKQDLDKLNIDRIVLAAPDNSYLMTYTNPAVYDKIGKNYLISGNLDKPCLFTVSKAIPDFNLTLTYRVLIQNSGWLEKQQTFSINTSMPFKKTNLYTE
jgi:hypothetical protein